MNWSVGTGSTEGATASVVQVVLVDVPMERCSMGLEMPKDRPQVHWHVQRCGLGDHVGLLTLSMEIVQWSDSCVTGWLFLVGSRELLSWLAVHGAVRSEVVYGTTTWY